MPIQLVEAKYYLTQDGRLVGPLQRNERKTEQRYWWPIVDGIRQKMLRTVPTEWAFQAELDGRIRFWKENGRSLPHEYPTPEDLVAESLAPTADLIDRLREASVVQSSAFSPSRKLYAEAADEIERLRESLFSPAPYD